MTEDLKQGVCQTIVKEYEYIIWEKMGQQPPTDEQLEIVKPLTDLVDENELCPMCGKPAKLHGQIEPSHLSEGSIVCPGSYVVKYNHEEVVVYISLTPDVFRQMFEIKPKASPVKVITPVEHHDI